MINLRLPQSRLLSSGMESNGPAVVKCAEIDLDQETTRFRPLSLPGSMVMPCKPQITRDVHALGKSLAPPIPWP